MHPAAVLLALASAAFAQQNSGVLLHQSFGSGPEGWTVMGQNAGTGTIGVQDGALSFSYELKPKGFTVAVLPAPPEIAGMRRMRFQVRSDRDTVLAVLLTEKKPGGGDYSAWFWSPANVWQQIELSPADFVANDGPTDPVDPDGKLDLDAVQGVALIDLAQFLMALPANPEFPMAIDRASGSHTVLVKDFELLGGTAAAARRAGEIDSFRRGFLEWATPGGIKLRLNPQDNPLRMPALQASYEQTEGRVPILIRRLGQTDLSGARRLAFDVASVHDATLVVSLEMKAAAGKPGPRFNMMVYPPADEEVFHVNLNLSDFEGSGKLDPAQLKTLIIGDITAAQGGATQPNTIWIGKIEMSGGQ